MREAIKLFQYKTLVVGKNLREMTTQQHQIWGSCYMWHCSDVPVCSFTSTASHQALQIAPVFGICMFYLLQSHLGSKHSHTDP